MSTIRTYALLVPTESHPVQLVVDLVDFDLNKLGGWDRRTRRRSSYLMQPSESQADPSLRPVRERKWEKKKVSGKRSSLVK